MFRCGISVLGPLVYVATVNLTYVLSAAAIAAVLALFVADWVAQHMIRPHTKRSNDRLENNILAGKWIMFHTLIFLLSTPAVLNWI